MTDIYGCICRKCGNWHNNVNGDGICLECRYKKDIKKVKLKSENKFL